MAIRKKGLLALAAIGGAAGGAGLIQGMAQVISAPAGAACVATAGDTCTSDVAVSSGGSATGAVAMTYGGSASAGIAAVAVDGTACAGSASGVTVAAAVGGSGAYTCPNWFDTLAVGTQGTSQACSQGAVIWPAAWWAVAVNLTGSASVTCTWPTAYGGGGAAVAPLGSATICGTGAAVSVKGQSTASCSAASAAVSAVNTASAGGAALSGTSSATGTNTDSAAVSGTGDATAGVAAVSVEGNAYACGGPVTFSESVTGNVTHPNNQPGCPGSIPLPVGSINGPGVYAS